MPIPAGGSGYIWPVSLADARKQLSDTDATLDAGQLQTVIDAATGIVENLVGPISATAYNESFDGGRPKIVLRRYPVLTITSITEYTPSAVVLAAEPPDTTTTFTSYGYTVDLESAEICRTSGGMPSRFALGRVSVLYTAGRATCPAPVYDATLKLIAHMWSDQRGDGAGRAVAGGGGDEYQPPETAHLIPWEVEEALAPYRLAPKVG